MVALLTTSDGSVFADGVSRFRYVPANELGINNRILASVNIGGVNTAAIIDTAATWSVCPREIADLILPSQAKGFDRVAYSTRYGQVPGSLHRIELGFIADEGESVSLEATMFVPDPDTGEFPAYIGLVGCLESMRMAIDMNMEMFYFSAA